MKKAQAKVVKCSSKKTNLGSLWTPLGHLRFKFNSRVILIFTYIFSKMNIVYKFIRFTASRNLHNRPSLNNSILFLNIHWLTCNIVSLHTVLTVF